jgi:hypothetical protein
LSFPIFILTLLIPIFPLDRFLPQPEEHGLLEAFVRELGASKPCEFIFAFGGIFFLFASIC